MIVSCGHDIYQCSMLIRINKAADYAVSLMLNSLAEDYFKQPYKAVYTMNREMSHKDMQAALAAIGISDQSSV